MVRKASSWDAFRKRQGFRTAQLGQWKDDPGSIVVWLHTESGITPRLFHLLPYVDEDDKGKDIIKYLPFVCHEDVNDYFNKVDASKCPIDRCILWLNEQMVKIKCPQCKGTGKLGSSKCPQCGGEGTTQIIPDNKVVWDASIGNPKVDRVATAIDFVGDGDWRSSFKPKVQYVFAVVNAESPENGLLVAVESSVIGDGIQKKVNTQIEKFNEKGDPALHPYPFRFKYNKKAKKPADFYEVDEWESSGQFPLTDEVSELLAKPALDLSYYLNPSKTDKLREIFEKHFKVDVDLDMFFDNPDSDATTSEDFDPEKLEQEDATTSTNVSTQVNSDDGPAESDNTMACETCGGTGKVGKKQLMCPDCLGTGVVADDVEDKVDETPATEPERVPCDTCDGTGKLGKKKTPCPDCEGTGFAPIDETETPVEEPVAEPEKAPEPEEPKMRTRKPSPAKEPEKPKEPEYDPKEMSQCPKCGKMTPDALPKCIHCGLEFADD